MGEARRRKLAGDTSYRGDAYKYEQYRLIERMKKFIERRKQK